MPSPVFAEIRSTADGSSPTRSATSAAMSSGRACARIDLVQDRNDLEIVLDRQIGVGKRLRLDALSGIDDQQCALARASARETS